MGLMHSLYMLIYSCVFSMKFPWEMMRTRGWRLYWTSQKVTIVFFTNLHTVVMDHYITCLHLNLCSAADQAMTESIPLSPQWLYAKPNDPKMVILQALQ